jgi:amino acid permease
MIGGSIISLPLAFAKCGIVLATMLLFFAASLTDCSLRLLCKSARQSGVSTYAEVGRVAFGHHAEYAISAILFLFLFFVLVASMALAKDIWTPLIAVLIPQVRGYQVMLGIVLVASPFLVQSTLYSLRYLCYMSLASTLVATGILSLRAYQTLHVVVRELELVTNSFGDALVAFPVITLSFLSSFNVLQVQSTLFRPTDRRINGVVGTSTALCFLLTYLFGLSGYLIGGTATEGNILLNLNGNVLGHFCCGVVMICAMAVVMLPCRSAILQLIETLHASGACPHGTDCEKEGQTETSSQSENRSLLDLYVVHEGTSLLPRIEEDEQECFMIGNPYAHYGSTIAILAFSFLGAMKAPSVAIIWSFCGPTLAFLISFFFPAACYLEIQRREPGAHVFWGLLAWFLIIFSVVAAIACTMQIICISFDWPLGRDGAHVHNFACSQQQTILWLPCSS